MPVRYSPDEPEYDDVTHWEVGLGVELYSTFSSPVRIASIEVIRYRDQDFVKSTSVDGVVGIASTNRRPYLWPKTVCCRYPRHMDWALRTTRRCCARRWWCSGRVGLRRAR